jgi:hypothetical protein
MLDGNTQQDARRQPNQIRSLVTWVVIPGLLLSILLVSASLYFRQETRNAQQVQEDARKQLAQQQQEHDAFVNKMSPAQHLAAAKSLLRASASDSQINEGMQHLAALNWTPLQKQGELIRDRYEKEKERVDYEAKEGDRISFAKKFQDSALSQGLNVNVTPVGPQHSTLQINWVLATRVEAYQITNDEGGFKGLRDDARRLGFKKLVLTDGYDTDGGYDHRWTWNIH